MGRFNIKSIIESPILNLINVKRYSGFTLVKDESVSDHVWGMITLALELIPEINEVLKDENKCIDVKSIIYRVAIHDIDESITCDIPRPMKYYTPEFRDMIEQVTSSMLKTEFPDDLVHDILTAKDNTLDGEVISILDLMQAGIKMRNEIKLGNQFMRTEVPNVISALEDLSLHNLKNYSESAYAFIQEVLAAYIMELRSV